MIKEQTVKNMIHFIKIINIYIQSKLPYYADTLGKQKKCRQLAGAYGNV